MKAKALKHILENGKRHKPGEVFETDAETLKTLVEFGHAEKVEEPKKKTRAAK